MGLGAGSPTRAPPCQAGQRGRGLISQGGGSCFVLELVRRSLSLHGEHPSAPCGCE